MATRPTLKTAVAGQKNKASDYNDNFDLMMDFIDNSIGEAKDYVDDFMPSVTGKAGKFLTNDGTDTSWAVAVPVGTIFYYGFTTAPSGWLVCDGSAISRTTYADLYSAIGTTFGEGDESTTFNLPDLIDKFPQGSETVGTAKNAGLPNITGNIMYGDDRDSAYQCRLWTADGAFAATGTYSHTGNFDGGTSGTWASNANFNASRSSAIYGNSTTVQPPALTLLPIIKY